MMYYCENCMRAVENDRCPVCRRRHLFAVRMEDYCYLTTLDKLWSEPLKDFLTDNGIAFVSQRCSTGAAALYGIAGAESEKIFVRFMDLEKAKDLEKALSDGGMDFDWEGETES